MGREGLTVALGLNRRRSQQGRQIPQGRVGGPQSEAHSRSQPCREPQSQRLEKNGQGFRGVIPTMGMVWGCPKSCGQLAEAWGSTEL